MNPRSVSGPSVADKNKLGQFLSSLGQKWWLTEGDSSFGDSPPQHKEAEFFAQETPLLAAGGSQFCRTPLLHGVHFIGVGMKCHLN